MQLVIASPLLPLTLGFFPRAGVVLGMQDVSNSQCARDKLACRRCFVVLHGQCPLSLGTLLGVALWSMFQ